ncbi:MAG: hypothetical protein IJF92_05435 [Bacilli bacterium]|nr:hypothetical protein [Bacilli bacterium]
MKNKNMKFGNVIILVLSVTIIFIAIGFMYLSIKLNTCSNTKNKYEVKIVKVVKETVISGSNKGVKTDYELADGNKTIKFKFNLKDNKDFISYTVVIKNTGTLPAQIDNIIEKSNYQSDMLDIKYNDVIGDIIEPGDEVELSLSINSPKGSILSKDLDYQATILTSNIK